MGGSGSPPTGPALYLLGLLKGKRMPVIGGSCHKYHYCRGKGMLVAMKEIVGIKYVCRDKTFACFCCDERRVLLRQIRVCRDKMILVAAPANDKCRSKLLVLKKAQVGLVRGKLLFFFTVQVLKAKQRMFVVCHPSRKKMRELWSYVCLEWC